MTSYTMLHTYCIWHTCHCDSSLDKHAIYQRLNFFPPGKSFAATVNDSITETTKVFEIPLKSSSGSLGGKPGPALTQWTEVQHHPGLVCALSQVNPSRGGHKGLVVVGVVGHSVVCSGNPAGSALDASL